MRLKLTRLLVVVASLTCLSASLYGQGFSFSCSRDTTIAGCSSNPCFTLRSIIPDIRAVTDSYFVNRINNGVSSCMPMYADPAVPGTPTTLTTDDKYSAAIPIGFPFSFYGAVYNNLVVSTNGAVSFNISLANLDAQWTLLDPPVVGVPIDLPDMIYEEGLIMGPYHDINLENPSSPARLIHYTTVGAAPNRKWILSFYKIPLFSINPVDCGNLIENTHQIVLYESTGIIEVLIFSKQSCTVWNDGRAMVGIQSFDRLTGQMAPGRKASDLPWGTVNMNEAWRFVPATGASLLKRVELYDNSGNLVATGTANNLGDGTLEALFPNICPPPNATTTYIVRPVYSKIDNPAVEIFGADTVRVTRTAATNLNATATTAPTTCGQNVGQITVTVPMGIGVAPFQYSVDAGALQASNIFSNLAAGPHTVHVQDAGGCTSDINVNITSTGSLAVTYTKTNTTCSGAANGTITVTPPLAVPPITYSINNGPYVSNNIFSNLVAGTYQVRVLDNAGCQATISNIVIAAGPVLTMTSTSTPASCSGANNGSITVTNVTGTAPFQYSINSGAYQVSPTFSNLIPSTYFLLAKDALGCTSAPFHFQTVGAGNGTLTGTAAVTPTSCSSFNDGSITVTATSGSGPYEYSIDNGVTWQNSNTFTSLAANPYTVRIRENGTCTSSGISATVNAGTSLSGTATSGATSCNGATNGSIIVTATSGSGPYEYSIDNGATWQNSNTFTNLAANPYTVKIRQGGTCTSNGIAVTVNAGAALTGTAAATATSCNGAINGSITITATSGSGPYEYSIDNGTTWQASNTFNGLTANTYSIKIREGGVCTSNTISTTVAAGATLTGTATPTATSCNGAGNGSITVTATSGTAPYEYSIDNGITWQAGNTFSNLAANTYSVKIRQGGVCLSNTINVTVAAGATLSGTTTTTPTACVGVNDGSITVTPNAGFTGPFEYSLDGGIFQASNIFNSVSAAAHNVVIRNTTGCSSQPIAVTVAAGVVLTGTATPTATSCSGASNGSITVAATSGTGPYEYSINNGTTWQASNIFNSLAANTYSIKIREGGVCTSNTINSTVTAGAVLSGTTTTTPTACAGVNNGSITVTPDAGFTGPFEYSLDGGIFQASNIFNAVSASGHNVVIRNNTGCLSQPISVTVAAGTSVTGTLTSTSTSCNGASDATITATPTNGSGPYQYSLDGSANQANNVFTGITTGPHNIIITDNFGCISLPLSITVTAGSILTGTATPTATSCNGASNGSITVTATSGAGPYDYSINNGTTWQTNNTFTNLVANPYSVIIRQGGVCVSNPINVTINAGAVLTGTTTTTPTACVGVNNGSITVTPDAGFTGPFEYSLDGGVFQTSNVFNAVSANGHNIIIRNNTGCSSQPISTTVAAGTSVTGTLISTPTSCNGATDAVITATPTNGTGPYQYSLDGGANQTSNLFNAVATGPHNIIITDNFGCTSLPLSITVNAGSTLTGTATPIATSCNGASNGSITVTATSGSGPYEYSIDNGTTWQTNNTFTNLVANPYSVIIRQGGVCISNPIPITVTAGAVLTGTTTTTPTACTGVNNGSITVTPNAGFTGPFEYSLDGGVFQTSNIFNAVSASGHNVVIRNSAGCSSQPVSVTVAAGTSVTGTLISTPTSCNGATDATITATPTNGTGPYQYSLDGGANQANNVFAGVTAGPHNITITDNFNCTSLPLSITINAGSVLSGTTTTTPTACAGVNNGSITVTPDAGFTGPFEYSLDGGVFQTSNVFNAVSASGHNIVIRNNAGCSSQSIPVTVAAGNALTGTATPTHISCNGAANGVITIAPGNGSAPYQYSLDAGPLQASNIFNNLTAGLHSVIIRDAFGCASAPIDVTISQPAQLTVPAPVVTAVICNGENNGSVKINPTGGTIPYLYSLDNTNYQASNTFNISQGIYTVYIRDAKGCSVQFNNISVTQPQVLNANIVSTSNATCSGGSDGRIEIAATGGVSPYQYSLDGTNFQSSNILNVQPGTYTTVKVRDVNNCVFSLPNAVVGLTDNLTLALITPAPICEGSSTQLQVNSNGTSFGWAVSSSGLSNLNVPDPIASPNTTTTYTVTATLGSCTKSADVTVAVMPAPVPDAGAGNTICFGQDYQLQASGGVAYSWTPSTYLDNATVFNPQVIRPDKTITYTLSVRDANNCPSLITDQVTVNVTPPIKVFVSPVDTVVYAGDKFRIFAMMAGTDTSYTWSPPTRLSNPNISNPIVTAGSPGDVIPYKVIASTSAGCQGAAIVTVRVYEGPDLYVPTAFTPNGDGKNDVFIPFPVGIKQLNYFRVFNRWGQELYLTKTLNQGWNGTMNGVEQASGVYIWMAEAVTQDGRIIKKKGTIMLIR